MKLYELAHSRTGDKGNISNVSLIAYDPADYEPDESLIDYAGKFIQPVLTSLSAGRCNELPDDREIREHEDDQIHHERLPVETEEPGPAEKSPECFDNVHRVRTSRRIS